MRPISVAAVLVFGCVTAALGQAPVVNGALNDASFTVGQGVAPGSLVAIFGSNFGSGLTLASTVPLSNQLGGASVTINGIPAPLVGVASTQINAAVPWGALTPGTPSGTAQVVVTTSAGSSAPFSMPLLSMAPGLFDITSNGDSTGVHRPAAYNNVDYTLPLPAGVVIPPFSSRPSKHLEDVVLWATGLGQVTNPPSDGQPGLGAAPFSAAMTLPTVLVGGVQAQVSFAVLSPEFPTIYQIAIKIPAGAPAGDAVPVQIQQNGITTTNNLKIAISTQ